jgi:hypothetical protein
MSGAKIKAFTLRMKKSAKGTTYWVSPYGGVDLLAFEDKDGPGDIVVYYSERLEPAGKSARPQPAARPKPRITPRPQPVVIRNSPRDAEPDFSDPGPQPPPYDERDAADEFGF